MTQKEKKEAMKKEGKERRKEKRKERKNTRPTPSCSCGVSNTTETKYQPPAVKRNWEKQTKGKNRGATKQHTLTKKKQKNDKTKQRTKGHLDSQNTNKQTESKTKTNSPSNNNDKERVLTTDHQGKQEH